MIHEGARAAKRELSQLKDLPDAPDFPPPPGREPHMKSFLATFAK
jgi:23S rRNA (cytosine1962-C5)-methyltransferase